MTILTHFATTLRKRLVRFETGFDRLVRIQFNAPWRATRRSGR